MARRGVFTATVVLVVAACGGGGSSGAPSTSAPAGGASAALSPLPSTAGVASESASARPSGPIGLPICHEGASCPVPAGAYVTVGGGGFFPGLRLSIPEALVAGESDVGEISLHPADHPDYVLLLWKDIAAVVSNHRTQTGGTLAAGVGTTPETLITWFTSNPDFKIITPPQPATVGDGIAGTVITMGVSDTADFGDPECPANPHCASFIKDPNHWGDNFYAIAAPEVTRMFLATASYPGGDHTFVVAMDVPNLAALEPFATRMQPILDSLRLPKDYDPN